MDTSKLGAWSEQPGDLLCDRVKVNVVETGSGWQTWHGAHLRGKHKKSRRTLLAGGMRETETKEKVIVVETSL